MRCPDALSAAVGTARTAPVSATDADSRITTATLSGAAAGSTLDGFAASSADGAPGSATLTIAPTTARGTYELEVVFATDDDPAQTARCTVDLVVSDTQTTPVHEVQGSGGATPLLGQDVVVEAVVTSLITSRDDLTGFFVEDEDVDADGDAATSEGV